MLLAQHQNIKKKQRKTPQTWSILHTIFSKSENYFYQSLPRNRTLIGLRNDIQTNSPVRSAELAPLPLPSLGTSTSALLHQPLSTFLRVSAPSHSNKTHLSSLATYEVQPRLQKR